jgi:hypothetical protein
LACCYGLFPYNGSLSILIRYSERSSKKQTFRG